jgi:hypothetical protein
MSALYAKRVDCLRAESLAGSRATDFDRQGEWAQVAERLMAADCKSAAPWSYGGSNPPLCTTDVRAGLGEESEPVEMQADTSLNRRFRLALALYAVLGLLVWFTMGEGKLLVHGKLVEMRLVPLIVIGGLALRTVVARQAEKIRRQDGKVSGS